VRLPHADRAVVDMEKLRRYCLSAEHPRGRHKARVFAATLGLTADNAEQLRSALLAAARSSEATAAEEDSHGRRYVIEFSMRGPRGRATVHSTWIVRRGEDFPRLATCYVL
jgi:hypothetical protein